MDEYDETFIVEVSIDAEDLFDGIAEGLQNDDELDMSYDEILEALHKECTGFLDIPLKIFVNTKTKKIDEIMT